MPGGTASMLCSWLPSTEWPGSVRHFLEVLDELNHLGIEFVSFRENIGTGGPLGRAMVVIVGAIAELERSLFASAFGLECVERNWKGGRLAVLR
jgi:Resolvase, N terminal domain